MEKVKRLIWKTDITIIRFVTYVGLCQYTDFLDNGTKQEM